jgi:hypothetical protein
MRSAAVVVLDDDKVIGMGRSDIGDTTSFVHRRRVIMMRQ